MESRMKLTFFDDFWVDFRPGTLRRWFAPELWSIAPIDGAYASLCCNRETGKYQLFYETFMYDAGQDGPRVMKMVESTDMKCFTPVKNDQGGDVLFDGDGGLHGASVLYDLHETDPQKRYKFCGMTRMHREKDVPNHFPVVMAFSPDGIHWEHHPEIVANPNTSDALNKLYYDPCAEKYRLLHRSACVDRRISIRSSEDLVHWSEPQLLLHPGASFNDGATQTQHYSMSAGWFDGMFYGLLWRYTTDINSYDYSKMFGVMDTELVYSYDGRNFMQTTGKPLVERPLPPTPGCAGVAINDMCESLDGTEYYMTALAYLAIHGTPESNKKLGDKIKERGIRNGQLIYKIRKDGFCGVESLTGGLVITKGIELLRDDLTYNLRADCGSVRFGIMGMDGKYLEGFSLDDCLPFEYDQSIAVRPRWKQRQLSDVLGRQLRLVVELNGAILHAASATARPYIFQPQKSFADPQGIF